MSEKSAGLQNPERPAWRQIYTALESWRTNLDDPSVTTVAEKYRQATEPAGNAQLAWAVLVSTILSLRTKDEVTLVTSKRLLEKAKGPAELNRLAEEEVARLAYPAGFYRTKAASLKKIAAILLDKYGGNVPADMDSLLALPGVGRKTANLVLIEAFDLPGICVDVHVHRICNRAGWIATKNPEETEMTLRRELPQQYWKGINALLVLYGQNLCRPVSPFCSRCTITKHCQRNGVDKSR
jgi:endonuclease-3